jgi:hypothetical protein
MGLLPVMDDDKNTVGNILTASLPTALAAGMLAIGALLISLQVQSARVEATVQQMAKAVEELKNDTREQIIQLDQRVRVLEMKN